MSATTTLVLTNSARRSTRSVVRFEPPLCQRGELSRFGGKATRLMPVCLSGTALVAPFARPTLGRRLETALRVVVAE
jgi:hypothetical protein